MTLPSLGPLRRRADARRLAHAQGWPIPVGGSASIARPWSGTSKLTAGDRNRAAIGSLAELPAARATLLDVAPPACSGSPATACRQVPPALESFRFGNGACKVDFILSGPVPWAAPELADAGTVHVGGTRAELAEAENQVAAGSTRTGRMCWCPSRRGLTPAAPRTAGTSCGPTAMSRPVQPGHGRSRDRPSWTVRAGIPGPCGPSPCDDRRRACGRTTGTTWRRLQRRTHGSPGALSGPCSPRAVADTAARRVPLFLLHPARPGVTGMPGFHAAKYALKDIFGLALPTLGLQPSG